MPRRCPPPRSGRWAGIRIEQKKPEEASVYLQAALKVDPTDTQSSLFLASYYESKGNRDQALRHVEEAYRADPAAPGVKVRLAELYGAVGRVQEGLARAREVVATDPKSAPGHRVLGALYLRQGVRCCPSC